MAGNPEGNSAEKDRSLFDTIAGQYYKKDLMPAHRKARRHRLMQTLKTVKNSGRLDILEVGCGAGFSAEYLRGYYNSYTGVDYSNSLINYANSEHKYDNVTFFAADIRDFQPGRKYDVILMIGLLHHLEDAVGVVKGLALFLKPGGIILANEPQSGNPLIRLARVVRKQTDSSYSEDQLEYSKAQLRDIAVNAGLSEIIVRPQGFFSTPFAEVTMPLQKIAALFSAMACSLDTFLERYFSRYIGRVTWNLILEAKGTIKPKPTTSSKH